MVLDELAVRRTSPTGGVPMDESPGGLRWISTAEAQEQQWPNILCPCCGTPPDIGYTKFPSGNVVGACMNELCPVQTWHPQTDTPSWWAGNRAQGKIR